MPLSYCLGQVQVLIRGRDSSVGKSSASQSVELGSASQSGDLTSNPGEGLTQVTQCMNERGRDYQL